MVVRYGFYNSVGGDRLYDSIDMSRIFDGIVQDGVYAFIGTKFGVTPGTGMQVLVGVGRAWFNHTWTYNDAQLSLTVPTAHATLPRIDSVILEVNEDNAVRANSIKIISGTAASDPQPPILTNDLSLHQYRVANIYVAAGATSFTQNDITNSIGGEYGETPFVESAIYSPIAAGAVGPTELATGAVIGGKIAASAINNSNMFYPGIVDAAAIGANAVGSSELASGSVIAGKIAAGAVNLTTALADNIVDDTKVGNRVAQFYRRQGGSPTDWTLEGITNYTPGAVRMVGGVIKWSGAAAFSGTVSVDFPPGMFSNQPLVFAVPKASSGATYILCRAGSATTSTFSILWRSLQDAMTHTWVEFNWLAIGPE